MAGVGRMVGTVGPLTHALSALCHHGRARAHRPADVGHLLVRPGMRARAAAPALGARHPPPTRMAAPRRPQSSPRVCPYAQRVLIALHEKGIPFTPIELATQDAAGRWAIPLGDAKPAWFTRYNPDGRVPTMLYK